MLKDNQGVAEVELVVDDGAGVDLDAVEGEGFLVFGEEFRLGDAAREVPEGEDGEEHGGAAFDDKEIAPVGDGGALDLEDAEGDQAREGVGDVGGGIEDSQPAGELAASVECGQVVDDEWEEGGFTHAQEPAKSENAPKVLG